MRSYKTAGLVVALALSLGAQAQQERVLTVLLSSQLSTLEPQLTTDTDSAAVRYQIYNGLTRMTEAGKVVPDLAKSWKVSPDGKTYTFTLKPNVKFHDGTALNAQAVVASFTRLLDPKRTSSAKDYFAPIVESVTAPGNLTVAFRLKQPFSPFLNTVAHPAAHIVSPAAAQKFGDQLGQNPVGTGPYKFLDQVRGERVRLTRFDDYFGGRPPLAGITYRIVPEASTRIAQLETGEADVVLRVTPEEAARLEKRQDIKLKVTPTARAMFFAINMTEAPFNDVRVRQALNYAANVEGIVKAVFGGGVPLLDSPLAPNVSGYEPTMRYAYNPDRARALLKQAGREANDIMIDLWSPNGRYVQDATIAQAVAQQLQRFGFKVNLRLFGDFSEYLKVGFGKDRGDLILLGWAPSSLDAEGGLYQVLSGERANQFANASGYKNAEFDNLLVKARAANGPTARALLYGRAQEIVMKDAPWLFLYAQPVVTGMRSNVEGVEVLPSEHLVLRNARFSR